MRQIMPIVLVIVVTISAALSGAVMVLILTSGSCQLATQPAIGTLIGEIDLDRKPPGAEPSPQRLVAAIHERLNRQRWLKTARVEAIDGGLIEVAVLGRDPAAMERVERAVTTPGEVAIGVLATEIAHADLREQAMKSSDDRVVDKNGAELARWVAIMPQAELGPAANDAPARRTVERHGQTVTQALLVGDGTLEKVKSIERASVGRDYNNRPCLRLELTEEGHRQLTAAMQAPPVMPTTIRLSHGWGSNVFGVVIDGNLFGATAPTSSAGPSVQVSGVFTEAEAREWADIINSGPLPAPLRLVQKRATKP